MSYVPGNSYPITAICANCGGRWGGHFSGSGSCALRRGSTFAPQEPAQEFLSLLKATLTSEGPQPAPAQMLAQEYDWPSIEADYRAHEVRRAIATIHKYATPDPAAANHAAEPKRPALDWNKPTPFDPFKGYGVKVLSNHIWLQGEEAASNDRHPLQSSPDLANASHQVDYRHGSAWLVR